MSNRWPTLQELKISPVGKNNPHLFVKDKNHNKRVEKVSKEREYIQYNLAKWCNDNGLTLETEFKFMEFRKYRFDWAIPAIKASIEFEGIFSEKSRHTTVTGYSGDTDKYREAAKLGWMVLRYTAMNYTKLIQDLNEYFKTVKP